VLQGIGGITDAQVEQVRNRFRQVFASPSLAGIEALLFDRVSISSAEGGEVLSREEAAAWLRDRAGDGIQVSEVTRGTLAVLLQVVTDGWPLQPPSTIGRVTFNLHRFDPSGQQNQQQGDWKVDVVALE
jgi:hypothetical protein